MIARVCFTGAALLALLAGCQQTPRSRADAAANAACRVEVDRVYAAQNRADLSRRDERDTPFAASYLSGITTRQLGARFSRDNQVASCVNNAGPSGNAATDASIGPTFSPAAR